jgi:Effector Associated Constant Component 1
VTARGTTEIGVSDPSQIGALKAYLETFAPDVTVERVSGRLMPGSLGASDLLVAIASSSGLVAAIRTLPEFIRSRRAGFSIELSVKGERCTLTATNVDDITPILDRILNE